MKRLFSLYKKKPHVRFPSPPPPTHLRGILTVPLPRIKANFRNHSHQACVSASSSQIVNRRRFKKRTKNKKVFEKIAIFKAN